MALYEHIFLARQDVTPQQVETLTEHIKSKIASLGGAVTKVEPWGLKSLAFRIKKNRKGHYSLLAIDAPADVVKEMERQLSINEDVLRFMSVKVDKFEQSSNKNRRDDRPEGERKEGEEGAEA